MDKWLLTGLILGPMVLGILAARCGGDRSRSRVVLSGAIILAGLGIAAATGGSREVVFTGWAPAGPWLAFLLEAAEDVVIAWLGWRFGSRIIVGLGVGQLALTITEEAIRFGNPALTQPLRFVFDPLSIILVLIVTVIGSTIAVYALGYMRRHAAHAPATAASQGRFFFFLVGFLGLMNGLVLTDSIQALIIFWEATTLCSVMLIGHDRTPEALHSAKLALLIGAFGGLSNMVGSVWSLAVYGAPGLGALMAAGALMPMAFLVVGAMTKSALIPFQSWLLGAMVAPTPVSALLHSATMVKIGSYLVLRLAPAFSGTTLMNVVALAGAFSFAMTSALAIGQSNSKKVLAYSTIGNLSLIVAAAGIDTPLAYSAALMVLCYHALSKGLLFLCVGSVEQTIGSRDIEDMGGIRFRMPVTSTILLVGMASMLIPPFGMLLSKWMALEAALDHPLILLLIVAGSALTVVFWVKWMGRVQTSSYHPVVRREPLPASMLGAQVVLAVLVVLSGVAAAPVHHHVFEPVVIALYDGRLAPADAAGALARLMEVGEFGAWPVLAFIGLAVIAWLVSRSRFRIRHLRLPFLCGENVHEEGLFYSFHGPGDERNTAWAASLYLTSTFQEARLTTWANILAGLIAISLFAVVGFGG